MLTLPITERSKTEEWKTIITTATNNGYPKHIIYNLRDKMKHKKQQEYTQKQTTEHKKKGLHSLITAPLIRKITNIFKETGLNVAFRTTNTIQQQLSRRINNNKNNSGIYGLQCSTCNKVYVGQSG